MRTRANFIKIDPTHLDDTTTKVFSALLKKNHNEKVFEKDAAYQIETTANNKSETTDIKLTHHIIKRKRGHNKTGYRYEVVDKSIGSGGEATAYESLGVIINDHGSPAFKAKPRVVKAFHTKNVAIREYNHATLAPHLHAKPITNSHSHNFKYCMTMRRFPGRNLYSIIEEELNNKLLLSPDQRIALSLAILRAAKQQITANHLVHRDLKPDNMIVDLATLEVNIIDYSFSKNLLDDNDHPVSYGTAEYMAQEQFSLGRCTSKTDCYALGKTLAELWNAKVAAIENASSGTFHMFFDACRKQSRVNITYDYSASYLNALKNDEATQMKELFEQLNRPDPDQRWSLDHAIQHLEALQATRAEPGPLKKSRRDNTS